MALARKRAQGCAAPRAAAVKLECCISKATEVVCLIAECLRPRL